MSAILSADDLNDFISPSVACIKPIETLPPAPPTDPANPYEVTTEDAAAAANAPPAQISLTDCLACSGCVTSAEAILVSLQSSQEVLTTLDAHPSLPLPAHPDAWRDAATLQRSRDADGMVYVASVSPQARASIAATFGVSHRAAGHMIEQLLAGDAGLKAGGAHGAGFAWVLDTNALREIALAAAADEVGAAGERAGDFTAPNSQPKKPVLTSACPGWICYAEKTHPHVLPHVSKTKSPQALAGTLVKTVLARRLGVAPHRVWHMAVMPCFDKKLEASRAELTDAHWDAAAPAPTTPARDVDLVITSQELLTLASARGIALGALPRRPVPSRAPFPDPHMHRFLFPATPRANGPRDDGTSGGYLAHVLRAAQLRSPGSRVVTQRGRNADVVEYSVVAASGETRCRAARYYGFRNIQNLVRRLRPARGSRLGPGARTAAAGVGVEGLDYVEVMACPGGCTNGGGQVKVEDPVSDATRGEEGAQMSRKEWAMRVDEAYFSASSDEEEGERDLDEDTVDLAMAGAEDPSPDDDDIDAARAWRFVAAWEACTGLDRERLLYTTYRKVESDVGKKKASDVERVAGLAVSVGGGW